MIGGRKAIVGLALCAFLALALWPAFRSPAVPMDEGMVLVYPEMLLKGHLPYRDFESVTGPGNLLILSAAYAAVSPNILVERSVGLAYRLLILLAVFGIAQRWGLFSAIGCAFITALLLGGTDLWANTWYAGVALALCSLWTTANIDSPWRCLAGGFLAGGALLARCDFGPALILALLPLFSGMERTSKCRFVAGVLIGILPLIWMTIAVGPARIFHSLFLFPVFQLNAGRHLPISQGSIEMICLLGIQIIASILNISAGISDLREARTRARGRLLLGVAILGLAFIHYSLQRFDSGHALNAALVAVSFLPLSISRLLREIPRTPRWAAVSVGIVVSVIAMHLLLPTFCRYFYRGLRVTFGLAPARNASNAGEELQPGDEGIFITHNGRPFPFGFQYAAHEADKVLAELERVSTPGQRLFVGPKDLRLTNYCDTYIYYMEPQLVPATCFLEMNPGSANAPHSRLSHDIASADWIILNRRYDFLNESNRSTHLGESEPNRVVRDNFHLWFEHGAYLLFRNKRLDNAIMPSPLPTPGS